MNARLLRPVLAVAVCLMALPAFAQPPGGERGGRGGPGGPRGFGGRGGGDSFAQLLMVPQVRQELNLDEDQQQALQGAARELRPEGGRPDFDFRNASDEERRKFFEERRKEAEERAQKFEDQLETLLLPEQMDRLREISIQLQGPRALLNDQVAGKLELTSDQRGKIQQISEEMGQEMRAMFQNGGFRGGREDGDRSDFREKIRELAEKSGQQMVSVLTSEQTQQFEAMKGKPFEMPERGPGGFGGRGGENREGFRGRDGGERGERGGRRERSR